MASTMPNHQHSSRVTMHDQLEQERIARDHRLRRHDEAIRRDLHRTVERQGTGRPQHRSGPAAGDGANPPLDEYERLRRENAEAFRQAALEDSVRLWKARQRARKSLIDAACQYFKRRFHDLSQAPAAIARPQAPPPRRRAPTPKERRDAEGRRQMHQVFFY